MPLSPQLIAAYEHALYVVFAHPEVILRVGEPSPALDALLEARGAAAAALVTAANPRGEQRRQAENQAAMAALASSLSWPVLPAEGRDPEDKWPAEASLLVIGIPRGEAQALGCRLEQNAIVFAEKGAAPELVLLRKMRLVLDTQVWIDWLVFDDPSVAPLRDAVAAGRAEIIIDARCQSELQRVLGYPLGKRTLDAAGQAACLAQCGKISRSIEATLSSPVKLPVCRDPDDQKFLELAAAGGADCLVTRDRALLDLARRKLPFHIVAPGAF